MFPTIAIKVDVDTDRGTRLGVPNLARVLREFEVPACFLFSLGPDNTGKAIRRIFRPGFFKKVSRTSVISLYGVRTLLNGTLLPAPHIGRCNEAILRDVEAQGFEVGIHAYDHFRWQDYVLTMKPGQVTAEFEKARAEFVRVFKKEARTAGTAGWQTNAWGRAAYDAAGLLYGSDTRGTHPFFPRIDGFVFQTMEIPTTLPTFDELMGRPEFPDEKIAAHYISLLREDRLNVITIHAEIEGMGKQALFLDLLKAFRERGVKYVRLETYAENLLREKAAIPVNDLTMGPVDGRSGLLAVQSA